EILDGLFEPVFGTLAKGALKQHDADATEDNSSQNGFGRGEGQAEIGGCANGGSSNGNERVDQCLHGRDLETLSGAGIRPSPHSIAQEGAKAPSRRSPKPIAGSGDENVPGAREEAVEEQQLRGARSRRGTTHAPHGHLWPIGARTGQG